MLEKSLERGESHKWTLAVWKNTVARQSESSFSTPLENVCSQKTESKKIDRDIELVISQTPPIGKLSRSHDDERSHAAMATKSSYSLLKLKKWRARARAREKVTFFAVKRQRARFNRRGVLTRRRFKRRRVFKRHSLENTLSVCASLSGRVREINVYGLAYTTGVIYSRQEGN